jgi:hypothetical protein
MRKRIVVQIVAIIAIAMFFAGYFDTEVTAFLTIKVKYGIALFTLTILYAWAIYMQHELARLQSCSQSHYEESELQADEIRRLHSTILKLKPNGKKSRNTKGRS